MSLEKLKEKRTERITEWITGGQYAVAVEVDAIIYPERPGEPYLKPETVRYLEKIEDLANTGDVEALKKFGTVFVKLTEPASLVSIGTGNNFENAQTNSK